MQLNINQILNQLDQLFFNGKQQEVEPFLQYYIEKAESERDDRSRLILANELIGYYRSVSKIGEAVALADEMLVLAEELGLEEEYATTLLNAATAYRAAGKYEEAISMYQKAVAIYGKAGIEDARTAGLYNNMSMAYQAVKNYEEAAVCLRKALEIIQKIPGAESETATTYVNLASVYFEMKEYESGIRMVQKSLEIFEKAGGEKDAHYSGALALLAHGFYLQEEYEQSIAYYTKALQEILVHFGKNQSYAIICENCAEVLEKAGFVKEAAHLKAEAEQVYQKISKKECRMSGLELSRKYYETYGKQMIHELFPEYEARAAVGLVGHGSECLGFDDEWSKDHDFGPAFCIWLNDEDYKKVGKEMQKAYDTLPKEFLGFSVRNISSHGLGRVGVLNIRTFYEEIIGDGTWSQMEDEKLAMAVNGEVFTDPLGEFTKIRNHLKQGMPFSIWKRRVANAAALMAQSGQYNYARCMRRGDQVAASMALHEFVREGMRMAYLLNHAYMPYYKWAWKGLAQLKRLSEIQPLFQKLVGDAAQKNILIEQICKIILEELKYQNLTYGEESFLETHIQNILKARENMNPIIEDIVMMEWEMFQNVRNEGGRASCQDDFETFDVMRKSQFLTWNLPLLEQYKNDLESGKAQGRNLIMEKYAYMMESTEPEEYAKIESGLPKISEEKKALIEQIITIQLGWREEFAEKFPDLSGQARSIYTAEDTEYNTSFETYLRGELKTYSMETLVLYGRRVVEYVQQGKNMTEEIIGYIAQMSK